MPGILTDVNVEGLIPRFRVSLRALSLAEFFDEVGLSSFIFSDFDLSPDLDDRSIWRFCQDRGLLLLTDNRNHDGTDSLEETLRDSIRDDSLPVLSIGAKSRFETNGEYRLAVTKSLLEIAFRISFENRERGIPRLFFPLDEYR